MSGTFFFDDDDEPRNAFDIKGRPVGEKTHRRVYIPVGPSLLLSGSNLIASSFLLVGRKKKKKNVSSSSTAAGWLG